MASDKHIADKIFDWHYPSDVQEAQYLIQDIEKYIANPKNKNVMPYLKAQKEALELLITIPLSK